MTAWRGSSRRRATPLTDVPDLDPRWPQLLAAARAWEARLIPGTSTSLQDVTRNLRVAIAAFDEESET